MYQHYYELFLIGTYACMHVLIINTIVSYTILHYIIL